MRLGLEHKIIVGHPETGWPPCHEQIHRDICKNVSSHFEGFTAWQASGYWKGQPEPCTVILIATDDVLKMLTMQRCATSLAKAFDQECVYLSGPDGARLVYANATA